MSDSIDPRLERYLRALPADLPPPDLGRRIVGGYRRRRRRMPRALAAMAAALALLALVPGLRGPVDPADVAPGGLTPPPDQALALVRSIDRQLQAAYLHNAPPEALEPLWLARNDAVQRLSQSEPAAQPLRL